MSSHCDHIRTWTVFINLLTMLHLKIPSKLNVALIFEAIDPEIYACYKHTSKNYYFVIWHWWIHIPGEDSQREHEWMLIERGQKWPNEHDKIHEQTFISNLALERGIMIVHVDNINVRSDEAVSGNPTQQIAAFKHEKIKNEPDTSEINELPESNRKLQNELESKKRTMIVYILVISILGFISAVLMIMTIYLYSSKKMVKNDVQNTNILKSEPQCRQGIVLKEKWVKDPTAMGRFEPERFSDVINNLPVVQNVVLDGIIDEMETEEGMHHDSATFVG